ncbi:MAG: hypothetical protein ABSB59_20490 [Streptosporangiaceae bacterium]
MTTVQDAATFLAELSSARTPRLVLALAGADLATRDPGRAPARDRIASGPR